MAKIVPRFSLLSSGQGTEVIYSCLTDNYQIYRGIIPFAQISFTEDPQSVFQFNGNGNQSITWMSAISNQQFFILNDQNVLFQVFSNECQQFASNVVSATIIDNKYLCFLRQDDLSSTVCVRSLTSPSSISISVNNDKKARIFTGASNFIAIANEAGFIDLFDFNVDNQRISQISTIESQHLGPITDMAITSDGKNLYTSGADGLVKYWNLASLKEPEAIVIVSNHPVMSVRPSPIDKTLFVASTISGQVHYMSVTDQEPKKATFQGQEYEPFIWADFSPFDYTLIVASSCSKIHGFSIDDLT